jgi:Rieske Fe-S protein
MESPDTLTREPTGRRNFLAVLVFGVLGSIAAVIGALLGKFFAASLFIRPRRREGQIPLGPVSRFRDAREPVPAFYELEVPDGYLTRKEKGRVYIVADGNQFSCLSTTCTHLGCSVRWDARRQQFLCPCHGGVYAKDGTVVSGPPPRPLARLPVTVVAGQLEIRLEDLA